MYDQINLASVLIGALSAIGAGGLLKSFFNKKGENIATKQDIAKITKLTEEAKLPTVAQVENLRNQGLIFSENFNNIKTLERDALLEVNKKFSIWFNSLMDFTLVFYSYEKVDELEQTILGLVKMHTEYHSAIDTLHIFMRNEDLDKKLYELNVIANELQNSILLHSTNFINECRGYNLAKGFCNIDSLVELNKKYNSKQSGIVKASLDERNEIHAKITRLHYEFKKLLHHYLHEIINMSDAQHTG